MVKKEKKVDSKMVDKGSLTAGFMFLGIGSGFLFGNIVAGTLIGLGVGLLASYFMARRA